MKMPLSKKQKLEMLAKMMNKKKGMHSEEKESMKDEMMKGESKGESEGEHVAHMKQMKQMKHAEYGEKTGYETKMEGIGESPEEANMHTKEMLWKSRMNEGRSHSAPKKKGLPLRSIKGSNK